MVDAGLMKRFFAKVDVAGPDECWNWTASTAGKGYGQLKVNAGRTQAYAHRISYEIRKGEIPKGMMILHSCDNPRCCNPAHLSAGTCKDNLQDMKQKGRSLRGERNAKAKLAYADITQIFSLSKSGLSQRKIAEKFGVGQMQICRILRGERWEHLHDEMTAKSAKISGPIGPVS